MSVQRRPGKAKHDKDAFSDPPQVVRDAAAASSKRKGAHKLQRRLILLVTALAVAATLIYFDSLKRLFHTDVVKVKVTEPQAAAQPQSSRVVIPGDGISTGEEDDPFIVAELLGKGKGMLAIRDIEQGERIITEKPAIQAPDHIIGSPAAYIQKLLNETTPEVRKAILDLSYVNFPEDKDPKKDLDEVALAIFQTNAVATSGGVALFPRMARLNHGCSKAFNAVYTWRDNEKVLVVHALKKISAGEEILTTYGDTKRPRSERRETLKQYYGFDCTCSVCALPDNESLASDNRLLAIADGYAKFATWGSKNITGVEAVETARKIWAIEEEEGYWSERGRLAADVSYVAAAHSE
ncbi:hypothetical protein DXG03_004953 [Asterophora parasitica]|uniref:SET domain-containing protein n=1 Tax=Asterophora parasitica TaxID=117018 RepID=A0A9P7GEZ0_9AGAR|nr:hypothetical protein DXG03_004953 [Asterophora parasitica]